MSEDRPQNALCAQEKKGIKDTEYEAGQLLKDVEMRDPQGIYGKVDVGNHKNKGGDTGSDDSIPLVA